MPPRRQRYWAKWVFDYRGEPLDFGQIVEDVGRQPNDEKLLRLGYLKPLGRNEQPIQCGRCGKWFVDPLALDRHGRKRHEERAAPPNPSAEDAKAVAEERFLREASPEIGDVGKALDAVPSETVEGRI